MKIRDQILKSLYSLDIQNLPKIIEEAHKLLFVCLELGTGGIISAKKFLEKKKVLLLS